MNIDILKKVCSMDVEELMYYLYFDVLYDKYFLNTPTDKELSPKPLYGIGTDFENYIYAEGDIPILLVAHLDTVGLDLPKVFKITHPDCFLQDSFLLTDTGKIFDDRAGVSIILEILELGYRPYILFTTGEEQLGIGVSKFIERMDEPFNVNYILEIDRKGDNEAVFYSCDNPTFTKYIKSFGLEENIGSFSDISILCPEWGIAGVNISAGYLYEHTKSETLSIKWYNNTIKTLIKMLRNYPLDRYDYIPKESPFPFDCMNCGLDSCEDCLLNYGVMNFMATNE